MARYGFVELFRIVASSGIENAMLKKGRCCTSMQLIFFQI